MPKFTSREAQLPLVEAAPVALETREQPGNELDPARPKFAPATAAEQSGKKMEFRRVRVCWLG